MNHQHSTQSIKLLNPPQEYKEQQEGKLLLQEILTRNAHNCEFVFLETLLIMKRVCLIRNESFRNAQSYQMFHVKQSRL